MIFQHTLSKVLEGTKTRTSRIQKEGDSGYLLIDPKLVIRNGRLVYRQHSVLAVQPQRGKRGVAYIKLLDITDRDVRSYSQEEIAAEGFPSMTDFLLVWVSMHDETAFKKIMNEDALIDDWLYDYCLKSTYTERYTAWALDFKLET